MACSQRSPFGKLLRGTSASSLWCNAVNDKRISFYSHSPYFPVSLHFLKWSIWSYKLCANRQQKFCCFASTFLWASLPKVCSLEARIGLSGPKLLRVCIVQCTRRLGVWIILIFWLSDLEAAYVSEAPHHWAHSIKKHNGSKSPVDRQSLFLSALSSKLSALWLAWDEIP